MTLHLLYACILPSAGILWWVMRRDRLPEPPGVVLITALLGALSTVPAIGLEMLLMRGLGLEEGAHSLAQSVLMAVVVFALVEECVKFLALRLYAVRHDAFDEPFDGIVYGVAAGVGFAAAENVAYVLPTGLGVGVLRAFTAVPMHAACGVLMGSCIGIGRFAGGRRVGWTLLGVAGAVALHGTYDTFVLASQVLREDGQDGAAALCVVGALGTVALSAGASMLGIARMRRDQERLLAMHLPPVVLTPAWTPATPPVMPPPPPPAAHAPVLPMVALLGGVASMASLVALAAIGVAASTNGEEELPDTLAVLSFAFVLAGGAGTLAGLVVGPWALVRETRWRAASIGGVTLAALAATLVVVGVVAEAVAG